ncbi:Signal transduction histidine kinase [Lachnospiraceae bacterium NE2001]|jgi:signal transduction histidine kinase|nr:Signal transduction histidine kinase [Lachnospiraceae bacterium NE2001]
MKRRVLKVTVIFSLLLMAATGILALSSRKSSPQDDRSQQLIDLNEISQLINRGDYDTAKQKTDEYADMLRSKPLEESVGINGIVMCTLTIIFMAMVFLYVYINILRPFDKMKDYASEVAKGNFDLPLNYERSNYFGAFTWAFDSMRKEITRSRMAEREAIENNKTVIATLSHDIKTPITSIRAYAEGLEENLDTSQERRSRYLEVLMRKCDEVTELTNDLFLHSLSDLNMLQMQPEEFELVPFLKQSISEIAAEREDVLFRKPDISPVIYVDKKRINQIVENLINNSRKYAKTNIIVSITQSDDIVSIHFRDKGPGIPDEDMPFITDKFYRGKNVGDENGSGLGLYIVRYIAEQSGGSLELINHTSGEEGLEAVVSLPIKKH